MTTHQKRLKKLMQSVGIQRNDFEKELKSMREYDEWDYQTIVNWVRQQQISFSISNDRIENISKKLNEIGVSIRNSDGYKSLCDVITEISDKWNCLNKLKCE